MFHLTDFSDKAATDTWQANASLHHDVPSAHFHIRKFLFEHAARLSIQEALFAYQEETGIGTGPEYEYPKTAKEDPETPIVDAPGPEEGKGGEDAPGEDAPELTEKEVEEEESLEQEAAREWTEDMAQNVPQPGDVPTGIPEDTERLPSDRG